MAETSLTIGQQVKIIGKDVVGKVAFYGTTKFAPGKWVGVVLDEPCGRNNGTVEGQTYFKCDDKHGLFVRQTQLEVIGGDGQCKSTAASTPIPSAPRSSVSTNAIGNANSGSGNKRRIEPTSLRRKPQGHPVPQKPDRLRLPIAGGGSGLTGAMRRTPSSGSSWQQSESDLTRSTGSLRLTPTSKESSPKASEAATPTSVTASRMSTSFIELGSNAAYSREEDSYRQPAFSQVTNFAESRTPASLAARQEERANLQELEKLRTDVKDLNEKLETLKIKRAQDKEKLKEAEKFRLQAEQLTEFKTRIMESQAQLQRELAAAKKEAREAEESRNQTVSDTQDLADTVELLTLDKEMAEERAEALQLELDQANEQIEELTLDLELLKEANATGVHISSIDRSLSAEDEVGGATLLQVKQLEQQNQRLHDTLVKMRDLAAHEKHEMQKMGKEMEVRKTELSTVTRAKDQLEQLVQEKLAQIADLQEQVDAALGAEDMVETLTERNLELEEHMLELEEQLRDLEDINYTNDLLMESAKEQELELREDLDMVAGKLRESEREREALASVVVDRDSTVTKFRELVQSLTEQNSELRMQLTKATNRPVGTPSEVIDFKKLFSETKAHSAAIDLELRQLELQQALDHVCYLKQYLPDNFMTRGGDQDAINLLLLLPRVMFKCDVVINGVAKFTQPDTVDRAAVLRSHAVDQYSFACRLRHLLHTLNSCGQQFQFAITHGTVEQFLSLGGVYPEWAAHERALDQYVEMLRKDQLDETIGLELLEKVVSSVQQLQGVHLQASSLDQPHLLQHLSRSVAAAADASHTEASKISALLMDGSEQSDTAQFLAGVKASCSDLLNSVKRIRRRLPQDGSAGPITYPGEVLQSLLAMVPSMTNVVSALRHIGRNVVQQFGLSGESDDGVSNEKIHELIHQATDLVYCSDDQGPESIKIALHAVCHEMDGIATSLEKGEFDYTGGPIPTDTPPIVLRAQNIKSELRDSEHVKYKLESKEQDLRELRLLLKQKNNELSEMAVRRDLAEKKLVTATKDSDATTEKLQRKLDDAQALLRRKEKEYEETMDHLQSDIDSLEAEKIELREKMKTMKRRSLYDSMDDKTGYSPSGAASCRSPGSGGMPMSLGVVQDSPALLQQIKDLQTALRCSTASNAIVTGCQMRQRLAALPPISSCRTAAGEEKRDLGKEDGAGESFTRKHRTNSINSLAQKTLTLKKELAKLASQSVVVDVSKRRPGTVPVTTSLQPGYQLQLQRNRLLAYEASVAQIKNSVMETMASNVTGGTIETSLKQFPTTQFSKALQEKGALSMLGEVRIPTDKEGSVVPVVLTAQHIRHLHHSLLH